MRPLQVISSSLSALEAALARGQKIKSGSWRGGDLDFMLRQLAAAGEGYFALMAKPNPDAIITAYLPLDPEVPPDLLDRFGATVLAARGFINAIEAELPNGSLGPRVLASRTLGDFTNPQTGELDTAVVRWTEIPAGSEPFEVSPSTVPDTITGTNLDALLGHVAGALGVTA